MQNQSEKDINPNLVWIRKIQKSFPYVYRYRKDIFDYKFASIRGFFFLYLTKLPNCIIYHEIKYKAYKNKLRFPRQKQQLHHFSLEKSRVDKTLTTKTLGLKHDKRYYT